MQLYENSPERRNLNALALSIIIYVLAGGSIESTSVKLLVTAITLERPWVISLSVWIILFWFCFRYWLVNKIKWWANSDGDGFVVGLSETQEFGRFANCVFNETLSKTTPKTL